MSGTSVTDGVTVPVTSTEVAPVQVAPAPAAPAPRTFTEDDIESARRQEKEKLYPRIDKLETQISAFNQEREALAAQHAEAQRVADEARKQREESELSAIDLVKKKEDEWGERFNTAQADWQSKFNKLQETSEAQAQLLERERAFQALKSYTDRRLAEEAENIMPHLVDLVTGNTEEEIESSISAAAARTAAIVADIQQALPVHPAQLRVISPMGGTPTGPLDNTTEQRTFTAADIAAMSMTEYAQYRDRLLPAASRGR